MPGLSDDAKAALLACFRHVAFLDDDANYYGALESALYADGYPRISAVFNSGSNVIYTDDALNSLKQYLTVTYYETVESVGVTLDSADYTLSGILVEGTSTVYVAYGSLATSFVVDDVVDFYDIWEWKLSSGQLTKIPYGSNPNQNDSPTRIDIISNSARRTFVTSRGRAPFYDHVGSRYIQTSYYPIPIPKDANYYTVKGVPNGYYFFTQVCEYDSVQNSYGDTRGDSRFTWTQQTGSTPIGHVIVGNTGNDFLMVNLKDSSEGSHVITTEPTELEIVFSTV